MNQQRRPSASHPVSKRHWNTCGTFVVAIGTLCLIERAVWVWGAVLGWRESPPVVLRYVYYYSVDEIVTVIVDVRADGSYAMGTGYPGDKARLLELRRGWVSADLVRRLAAIADATHGCTLQGGVWTYTDANVNSKHWGREGMDALDQLLACVFGSKK